MVQEHILGGATVILPTQLMVVRTVLETSTKDKPVPGHNVLVLRQWVQEVTSNNVIAKAL